MKPSDPIMHMPSEAIDQLAALVTGSAPVIFSLGGTVLVALVAMTGMRRIG